jgi:hypothetical protein
MTETRLLQVADIVAHAVFLLYERKDPSLIKIFLERFDRKDGVFHGLVHHRANNLSVCEWPSCASKTAPGSIGTWIHPGDP